MNSSGMKGPSGMGQSFGDKMAVGDGLSLYVHIPFCKTKCPYCDFNTYQGIEALIPPYVEALALEIRLWAETLGHPEVNTIFLGGGTPSYIPLDCTERLLAAMGSAFRIAPSVETTLEANPGDLNGPALEQLLAMGVNRLSIGVQSLDDSLLSTLGRRHSAREAVEAYRLAQSAGFERVNLDLMYGLPGQTFAQWQSTLHEVLGLMPPHLSLYCLTLEEGTPMERSVRQGRLPEPDPDLAADMYTLARDSLNGAGYHHYEISNWALDGQECLHNLAYWLNRSYLGVGPGAHSCLEGHRFWDVDSPREYIKRVQGWATASADSSEGPNWDRLTREGPLGGFEAISPGLEMAETMILGLRLLDGMKVEEFRHRFERDPLELYGPQIGELEDQGLLQCADGVLRLTDRGCLLANQVFIRFLE